MLHRLPGLQSLVLYSRDAQNRRSPVSSHRPISDSTAVHPSASRAVYFELFGSGGLYSVNFEKQVGPSRYFRAGAAYWSSENFFSSRKFRTVAVPLVYGYLLGSGNHHLETGGGVVVGQENDSEGSSGIFSSLTSVIGYRYQKPEGGFLFRVGFTPFLSLSGGEDAFLDEGGTASFGVTLGKSF